MTDPTADAIVALQHARGCVTSITTKLDDRAWQPNRAFVEYARNELKAATYSLAALLSAQGQAGKPVAGAPTWLSVKSAPAERWLVTCRAGERGASISCTPDGEEWIAPDGRTTVTHHTYLPPTHWLCEVPPIPSPTEKDDGHGRG